MTVAQVMARNDQMSQILTYEKRFEEILRTIEGFVGHSAWRDCEFPERYAVISHFNNEKASEEAFNKLMGDESMLQMERMLHSVPDVRYVRLHWKHGKSPEDVEISDLLSFSNQLASAGRSEELELDLENTFETLKGLAGYLGSFYGSNLNLEEEVIGVALWKTRRAFEASIPGHTTYEVRLFERIA